MGHSDIVKCVCDEDNMLNAGLMTLHIQTGTFADGIG